MLGLISVSIIQVGNKALEVAGLVTFRNACSFYYPFGTILHAAVAPCSHLPRRAIPSRHELPAGASAKWAILKCHNDSIRSEIFYGKTLLWENCGRLFLRFRRAKWCL